MGDGPIAELPRRPRGRTGLLGAVLGSGASGLESAHEVSEAQAEAVLNAALDAGVNYVDTAIDYGLSEQRIGKYLAHRRDEFYLASKCGCVVGADPHSADARPTHVYTAANIVAGVEQSLRRLRTDYLDVVLCHNSPSLRQLQEHDGLQELKQQGKVRFIGMSGWLPNLGEYIATGSFDVFLIPYSAFWREHEELITVAAASGAGIAVRNGAAKGGPGTQSGDYWDAWQRAELDDLLGDMTRMEFVIRFTLSHPDIATAVIGTVNPAHVDDNARALRQGPLPEDVYAEAKRRLPVARRPDIAGSARSA